MAGQYRVDFTYANYANPFSFTAGTAVLGTYDGTGTQTNTPAELQQGIDLLVAPRLVSDLLDLRLRDCINALSPNFTKRS